MSQILDLSKYRYHARRIMRDEPKVCYFCDATPIESPEMKLWHVHHIDGNETNNARENLAWSHLKCHRKHHTTKQWNEGLYDDQIGSTHTLSHRAKIGQGVKQFWTPQLRAKRSAATSAQWQKPKVRQRMVEAQEKRWANMSPEERAEIKRKISEGIRRKKNVN